MDGLNDEQRVKAWLASWRYSLSGYALLASDFSFMRVNSQWLRILDQPATSFYGQTFVDITEPQLKRLDTEQANLLIEGKIPCYVMNKSYVFQDGSKKDVTLLVTRVPVDTDEPFEFFLSRILLREANVSNTRIANQWVSQSSLMRFLKDYSKWIVGCGIFVGAMIMKVLGVLP